MEKDIFDKHIKAGLACGKERTCGKKINYKSEDKANKAVEAMHKKGSKELESYPCAFCGGWHIGRKMSIKELNSIMYQ